jgi:phosphomannomutase
VYDVPIRCLNYSGEDARVECQFGDTETHTQTVWAGQSPAILWFHSHPTTVKWRTDSVNATESYKSDMTSSIRSPEAQQAAKTLLEADHAVGAPVFVELLEESGGLVECAPLFVNHSESS